MKKYFPYFSIKNMGLFFLLALFFGACKNDKSVKTAKTQIEIDKSFAPFYDKFHSDEAYQLEHIVFPLQGLPLQTDSSGLANGNSYLQKEEWVFQNALDENSGFHREYKVINPKLLEELVINEDRTIGVVRRFVKISDEWFLMYYTKMGQVQE